MRLPSRFTLIHIGCFVLGTRDHLGKAPGVHHPLVADAGMDQIVLVGALPSTNNAVEVVLVAQRREICAEIWFTSFPDAREYVLAERNGHSFRVELDGPFEGG